MLTLTIEKNTENLSGRVRITGYTNYGHIEPQDDGTFRVYLFDHLENKTVEVTKASDFDPAVTLATNAVKDAAVKAGIDLVDLAIVSD